MTQDTGAWLSKTQAVMPDGSLKAAAAPSPVAQDEREAFIDWAQVNYRNVEEYTTRDFAMGLDAWNERSARAATPAQDKQDTADDQDRLFVLLCDIRAACGDNGKRMQPELVEYIRENAEYAARYRWLRDSPNSGGCIRAIYEDGIAVPDAVDALIDAAMQAQGERNG